MPHDVVGDLTEPPPRSKPRADRGALIVATVVIFAAVVVVALVIRSDGNNNSQSNLAARRADVERRGTAVMPFDQNLTTHQFAQNSRGGVETVTVNDPKDTAQVALVQEHLAHERELFAAGNFSDPMAIHGMTMPGMQDLQHGAAAGRITITYEALALGARLTYSTTDPALRDALHTWFDAQLMDHGSHATG